MSSPDAPLAATVTTVGTIAREAVGVLLAVHQAGGPLEQDLAMLTLDIVAQCAVIGRGSPVQSREFAVMMNAAATAVLVWSLDPQGARPPVPDHPLAAGLIGLADVTDRAVLCTLERVAAAAGTGADPEPIGRAASALVHRLIGMVASGTPGAEEVSREDVHTLIDEAAGAVEMELLEGFVQAVLEAGLEELEEEGGEA